MGDGQQQADPILPPEDKALLNVKNLTTRFPVKGGFFRRTVANVHAVEDVSFQVKAGQTLSLVGESGCGKSSCGRSVLRLIEPLSGEVWLDGQDVIGFTDKELRQARRDMQMIFQDPFASLNPQMKLEDQVAEPLINYGIDPGRAGRNGSEAFRPGGIAAQLSGALPARTLWGPAPAYRHRKGARAQSETNHRGRGGQRAGCVRSGASA